MSSSSTDRCGDSRWAGGQPLVLVNLPMLLWAPPKAGLVQGVSLFWDSESLVVSNVVPLPTSLLGKGVVKSWPLTSFPSQSWKGFFSIPD